MRRRPIAVYRVIDEEELLGGGSEQIRDGLALPDDLERSIPQRVRRRRRCVRLRSGWGSTAAAVAGLSVIAALLLSTTAHAPAAPRQFRRAPSSRQHPGGALRPLPLRNPARRHARLVRHRDGTPRASRHLKPRHLRLPGLHREDGSRHAPPQPARLKTGTPLAASDAGVHPVETPQPERRPTAAASAGPSAEFGFER